MILIIILVAFLLRLVNLNQSFWLDEAAQVIESGRSLTQQFIIPADFHPPLYHLILHFWMYFGKNEIWIRLLSVIFSLLTIYFFYRLCCELINKDTALLTSVLLSFAPYEIYYAQEARPYALVTLLAVLTTYLLFKKRTLSYIFTGILFIYSSYLAVFFLLAQGVYILFFEKKLFNWWFKTIFFIGISFIPWFSSLKQQLDIGSGLITVLPGWREAVSTPLVKSLPLIFTKFIIGRISFPHKFFYGSYIIILFIIFLFLFISSFKKKQRLTSILIIFVSIPIFSVFLFSFYLPIIAPQRLLFLLPFFYLILAIGILSLRNGRLLVVLLFLVVNISSVFLYYTQPKFQREQWRQAVNFVEKNRTDNSLVIFIFPDAFAPWQWYNKGIVRNISIAPNFILKEEDIMKYSTQIQKVDRIFYFHYLTDLTDPDKKMEKLFPQFGFTLLGIKDFPGVGFVSIYEKALAYY